MNSWKDLTLPYPENTSKESQDSAGEWKFIEKDLKAVVALGSFAWKAAIDILQEQGFVPQEKVKFSHGAKCVYLKQNHQITLLGSYHPSQQNTFTGRLTEAMLDQVFGTARKLITT